MGNTQIEQLTNIRLELSAELNEVMERYQAVIRQKLKMKLTKKQICSLMLKMAMPQVLSEIESYYTSMEQDINSINQNINNG